MCKIEITRSISVLPGPNRHWDLSGSDSTWSLDHIDMGEVGIWIRKTQINRGTHTQFDLISVNFYRVFPGLGQDTLDPCQLPHLPLGGCF